MWSLGRNIMPKSWASSSANVKSPTVGPKEPSVFAKPPRGPSGLSRPDPQVIQVVIGSPMCPHHCKACQDEK
ncbi:hypothetical protein SEA_WELCOME_22 [Microbacterium phage Welcome]|nr:hypothetical protein SEA_WELCOME_22 [Microbacterium phage Welcome]